MVPGLVLLEDVDPGGPRDKEGKSIVLSISANSSINSTSLKVWGFF